MRSFAFVVACAVVAVLLVACARAPGGAVGGGDADISGDWIGGFEAGKDWIYLQAHFRRNETETMGTFDLPLEFLMGAKLDAVSAKPGSVHFEIPRSTGRWVFDGHVDAAGVSGVVRHDSAKSPFRLHRNSSANTAPFVGTYRLGDGRIVHVRRWPELGVDGLLAFDFTDGRLHALFPSSQTTFFCGPSLLVTEPIESVVSFAMSQPESPVMTWKSQGATVTGNRVPLREVEMTFKNGDIHLAGTLVLPESGARHPAVVIAPGGTAAGTRDMGRNFADFLALNGVAVLIFDKRGTGQSSGDWLKAGFDDLAADVLAGVNALKSRDDIHGAKIGLLGFSQGGWVVALAASKSPDVAFIVSQSGPGGTPLEQELYRTEQWLVADGFPPDQVAEAMELVRFRFECARSGHGWERLAEMQNRSRAEAWYPYVGDSSGKDDPFWEFWRLIRDFDPAPALAKVRCPVLSILGEKDTYVSAEQSAAVWRDVLGRAGNRDVTVIVFAGADHSLLEAWTGGLKESPRKKRFVSGYLPTLRDWVLERVR